MRYTLLIAFFAYFGVEGHSQQLLVNGSFEEENICTEFSKNCAPEAWIGTAFTINYYFDTEGWAFEGRHFIGLVAGNKELSSRRSFIRSRLLCGLRKGNHYTVTLYARSRHEVFDSIGVYFSSTDFLFKQKPYQQLHPSLVYRDTSLVTYTGNRQWRKISFDYIATGDEIYITIGSFKKEEYRYLLPPEYKSNYYLFLDDFSMIPGDKNEMLCNQADSIKAIVYNQNERHSALEKRMAFYKKNIPVDPRPPLTQLRRIDTLVIPDILFTTASAALKVNSYHLLDSFCLSLQSRAIDSLVIDGHTDSVGTLSYNNKLSADRAASVSWYIRQKISLSEQLIKTYNFAYLRPVTSNHTAAGRQRNRRVEIYLYTHD